MAETVRQRKVLGVIWFIVPVVGIIMAFITEPIGDWGFFGIAMAVALGAVAASGLWMLTTGKGNLLSTAWSLRTQRIVAIIGLIAAVILIASYVFSLVLDPTAQGYLILAIWTCLGAMFADSLVALRGS